MAVCVFFGHSEFWEDIEKPLVAEIEKLICNNNVTMFYVGNHGKFDGMVRRILKRSQKKFPTIQYAVVLSALPGSAQLFEDYSDTILPEGIELVFPRRRILWVNQWMVDRADHVVCYVPRGRGGAFRCVEMARKQGKTIHEIVAEKCDT